jgi:pseudouridine-5'-monophosphatase
MGKPLPDIYYLALKTIDNRLVSGESLITPEQCLDFEGNVPVVESGRKAGMRVVPCPRRTAERVRRQRRGGVRRADGEAGNVGMHQSGEPGDGWAEKLMDLVNLCLHD